MKTETKRPRASLKGEIYRQSRLWHGYLSAFAFLALIFFAGTGLLLNHPEWFKVRADARPVERVVTLSSAELAAAKAAPDPSRALTDALAAKIKLRGAYQSGEVLDNEAQIRMEGVTGSTDILVDLLTGKAEVSITRADLVTTFNELHRGKNAGAVWKAIIDVSAILVLTLSLIGYVLFFTLRFRLRTGLILTGVSLAALSGAFWLFVP